MPEDRMVDPHGVVMTGENSFVRLSEDGGKTIADRVSHWRVLWSPAGQGHALFIESPLTGKGPRIFADNAGVARFLQRNIEVLLHKPFADESLPIASARFERTGNSLSTVEELIVSRQEEITLAWWDLMTPFILTMPPGAMGRPGSTAPSSPRAARSSWSTAGPPPPRCSRSIALASPRQAAVLPGRNPGPGLRDRPPRRRRRVASPRGGRGADVVKPRRTVRCQRRPNPARATRARPPAWARTRWTSSA